MSLTVQDILDKQFHVRLRGFDTVEVDEFLELVVENFSILTEENKILTAKVKSLSEDLGSIREDESTFRSAMLSAQKIADEMVGKSRNEADEIVVKGREEAEELLAKTREEMQQLKDDAHREVSDLESTVDKLSVMQDSLQQELTAVIESYQQRLADVPVGSGGVSNLEIKEEEIEEEQESSTETQEGDSTDLSDLYEKIELGDGLSVSVVDEPDVDAQEAEDKSAETVDDDFSPNIPDLESDIMFTLHDPLDGDEDGPDVDVAIDGLTKES